VAVAEVQILRFTTVGLAVEVVHIGQLDGLAIGHVLEVKDQQVAGVSTVQLVDTVGILGVYQPVAILLGQGFRHLGRTHVGHGV